jgi:phosphatidate phosphatase PAH1
VNDTKADYPMKLGEGGEAFFVFQTEGDIPEDMQTSPVVSPDQSPVLHSTGEVTPCAGIYVDGRMDCRNRIIWT